MNHYPRHIGDWIRDTAHLSEVEECIYSRMIDQYYSREKPLPADRSAVCRLVRAASKEARKAVDVVLGEFFELGDDGWHQKRCDAELRRFSEKSAKAAASAAARWGPAHSEGNANAHANAFQEQSDGNASQNQEPVANSQLHLSPPDGGEAGGDENPSPPAPAGQGQKKTVPNVDHEGVVAAYHAVLPMCPPVLEWNDTRRGYLQARWREKAVKLGWTGPDQGVEYFRRFFGYVAESRFLTGRADGRVGRPPFVASLEWLLRPTNFAKVVEGNFHGS